MRVAMKSSQVHSPDGTSRVEYLAGGVYDVPDDLGKRWIAMGVAVDAQAPEEETSPTRASKKKGGS